MQLDVCITGRKRLAISANILKAIEAGIFNDTTAARMKELEEQK